MRYDGNVKRRIQGTLLVFATIALGWLIAAPLACSASNDGSELPGTGGNGSGSGGNTSTSSGTGGEGAMTMTTATGGQGGGGGVPINPCGTECGDTELCETQAVALDDNCDGQVDEGCTCTAGTAQACFKGDPSYKDHDGCYPGTQKCTELGLWGDCEGGLHATENCFGVDQTGCHAISSPPFVWVDLKTGTGIFSNDAVSETWTVACPSGVSPCPAVLGQNPADDFQPMQSGEYTVTYDKTTANGSDQCTYPLFVGAPGLRVELEWEHNLGGDGVDVDLHLHKPNGVGPWGGDGGAAEDCAYDNCVAWSFALNMGPTWFNGLAPPDPVNWYLDPTFEKNTCYFDPMGVGQEWQTIGQGCHNPRLDVDNITCDPNITDPNNTDFCTPENINIDFPPSDEWTRVGVHYYSAHQLTYDVHPVVKIYCNGALAAELGAAGFYDPQAPITFTPADSDVRFWLVADVLFRDDECDGQLCIVEPLYIDPVAKTPILTDVSVVQTTVGPSYPPIPN